MSILLDGTGGVTTPGVVNTAGETIATTLAVTGTSALTGNVGIGGASAVGSKINITSAAATGITSITSGGTTTGYNVCSITNTTGSTYFGVESSTGGGVFSGTSAYSSYFGSGGATPVHICTNNVVQATVTSAGLLQFNSGYGSVATAYGCRAWVNFNGTGTVAIRASGNVSSITDNAVGNYNINFTTAMADANYSFLGSTNGYNTTDSASQVIVVSTDSIAGTATQYTASTMRFFVGRNGPSTDSAYNNVSIFR